MIWIIVLSIIAGLFAVAFLVLLGIVIRFLLHFMDGW